VIVKPIWNLEMLKCEKRKIHLRSMNVLVHS
jgi:hypothetical protein